MLRLCCLQWQEPLLTPLCGTHSNAVVSRWPCWWQGWLVCWRTALGQNPQTLPSQSLARHQVSLQWPWMIFPAKNAFPNPGLWICACPDQSIKGRISMAVSFQQTVAILHSLPKSQPINSHCQVMECRAERWVLWVHFNMTDRIKVLLSQVRATEGREKGLYILPSCSMISFQVTLSSLSGTRLVSPDPFQEAKQLDSLSPWQAVPPWGSSLLWDHL